MAVEPTPSARFAHSSHPNALLAALPEPARVRLRALRSRRDAARDSVPIGEDVRAAAAAKIQAQQRLARLRAPAAAPGGGFALKDTDPRVLEQLRVVEELTDESTALTHRYEVAGANFQAVARVLHVVEQWVLTRPANTQLEAVDTDVRLAKGDDVMSAVARLRGEAVVLRQKLETIASALLPSAEVKRLAIAEIDRLAVAGRPLLDNVFRGMPIVWPSQNLRSTVHNTPSLAVAFGETPDALATMCWLHRAAMIAAIEREIDLQANDELALAPAAKEVATAAAAQELSRLEHAICRLVDVAQAQRLPLEFGDEHASAVLGVQLITVRR